MMNVVYRCFDADGVLLYVGRTSRPRSRLKAHSILSPWWKNGVRVQIKLHKNRDASVIAERDAIRTERPLFNIQMQCPPGSPRERIFAAMEDGRVTLGSISLAAKLSKEEAEEELEAMQIDGLTFNSGVSGDCWFPRSKAALARWRK